MVNFSLKLDDRRQINIGHIEYQNFGTLNIGTTTANFENN